MKTKLLAAAMAVGLSLVGLSPSASVTALNIDFGLQGGPPSSSFGAASGQVGVWNNITAFVMGSRKRGIDGVHGLCAGQGD